MTTKLSFVLPVAGRRDILMAKHILIQSFIKFFTLDDIDQFIVIYRKAEEKLIKQIFKSVPFNIKYINEST